MKNKMPNNKLDWDVDGCINITRAPEKGELYKVRLLRDLTVFSASDKYFFPEGTDIYVLHTSETNKYYCIFGRFCIRKSFEIDRTKIKIISELPWKFSNSVFHWESFKKYKIFSGKIYSSNQYTLNFKEDKTRSLSIPWEYANVFPYTSLKTYGEYYFAELLDTFVIADDNTAYQLPPGAIINVFKEKSSGKYYLCTGALLRKSFELKDLSLIALQEEIADVSVAYCEWDRFKKYPKVPNYKYSRSNAYTLRVSKEVEENTEEVMEKKETKPSTKGNIARYGDKVLRIKHFSELGRKRPNDWTTSGSMDYLYGQYITKENAPIIHKHFEDTGKIIGGGMDKWSITKEVLITETCLENPIEDKEEIATYNGRILRFRTLEEVGGVRSPSWNSDGAMDYLFGEPVFKEHGFEIWREYTSTGIIIGGRYMGWHISPGDLTDKPMTIISAKTLLDRINLEVKKEEVYDEIDFIPISNITID